MKKLIFVAVLFAGTAAYSQDMDSYLQMLRSEVKTEKIALITKAMQFNEQESPIFWPIYEEYQHEQGKITDQRIALIKDFAANYDALTDEKASELAKQTFKLEEQRTGLKKKYFKKIEKALSSRQAAKFFQVENQINLLIDLQVAAGVPLIK